MEKQIHNPQTVFPQINIDNDDELSNENQPDTVYFTLPLFGLPCKLKQ